MSNKAITLLEFAQNKKIEIPIFQRDYAQGRNDHMTDKIRKDFVSSLIEALDKNIPIELDFIYGREVDNTITLIDGQQRLTTLFLLHWYISQRIGKIDAFKNIKFSYATRDYAKDFTAKLTTGEDFKIDFTQATLSTELKDKNWFYDDWQHDPTVSGMLNTLDEIHKQLRDKTIDHYWSLLEQDKQGIITFYWLDLEEHQLTDELYLKMNARGKQLSKFENFKASLVKRMANEQWEGREDFSLKMDTTYTDLFWQYRGDQTVIDNEAMNFFAGMAMIAHALRDKSDEESEENKKIIDRIQELFKTPLSVVASDYFSKEDFKRLKDFLNFYSKSKNLTIDTSLWKYFTDTHEKTFFEIFIRDNKATYPQRVFFYALTQLFIKVEDKVKREDFIRVVRNIIENTTIDSPQTFVSAIKLIHNLLEGCYKDEEIWINIYTYLNTEPQLKSSKYQVEQEIDKAKRIVADSQWKEAIWEAEDHPMFKGDIGFLLLETENNLDLFKKRYEVAKEMFDEDGVTDKYKENMLLIRALISRFDQWHLLTHGLTYDCEKDTWKEILEYDRDSSAYFLKVLDSSIPLEELVKQPSKMKDYEEPHQDLYQTNLLEAIQQRRPNNRGFTYHFSWGVHILYPPHYSGDYYGCIIGGERNKKLAQAVAKGIINTEQQLEWNDEKLPFFWGWNISFIYNNEEYWYYYNTDKTKITKNGQDCTEEALQKIFSSSL